MKISIITVCLNSEKTILETIKSVEKQTHQNIEYIIIDGGSNDQTLSIVKSYDNLITKIISEKDFGLYDAINKGLEISSGEVIGILNSDDVYANSNIISMVETVFTENNVDIVWGDIAFINDDNYVKRIYSGNGISPESFDIGIMPPHPSVFIKKKCYEKFGNFSLKYKIASDYELLLRFLKVHELNYFYCPELFVKMKLGGESNKTLLNIIKLNKEVYKIHKEYGFKLNLFKKIPKRILEVINLKV